MTSALQKRRLDYQPVIPDGLSDLVHVHFEPENFEKRHLVDGRLKSQFPHTFDQKPLILQKGLGKRQTSLRVGVVFSGGQAAGGHNVIAGIFRAIKTFHSDSQLFGFLNGPSGVIGNQKKELFAEEILAHMNQGGFDLIGTGRTKIETQEQLLSSLRTCEDSNLDGLVIIGGDDSNTNAAVLAEFFLEKGCSTRVVGVPKTIDGDLQSKDIEISFGFDSACKTYSELIGNIARDALSAKKYYHFIKLMGRSASHIALECALSTHPNLVLIGEEKQSLYEIVNEIADLICKRYEIGKEYGIILVPEGLIEFIPEMQGLITSLNALLAKDDHGSSSLPERLQASDKELFFQLPGAIQRQLLFERDPHGNVQVSLIDTQILLMELVKKELKQRQFKGKFSAQDHFFGYEGRSCFPSNFDANYCYALGLLAALSVRDQATGVICSIQHLNQAPRHWSFKMVPIVQLMHLEIRKGKEKPVIQKTVVDPRGALFTRFSSLRKSWAMQDDYQYPGPIQFFGPSELTDAIPHILVPLE